MDKINRTVINKMDKMKLNCDYYASDFDFILYMYLYALWSLDCCYKCLPQCNDYVSF